MFKLVVVGTVALMAAAHEHPINQKIVDEIKSKTNLWEPHELDTNPLKDKTYEELMGMLGGRPQRHPNYVPKYPNQFEDLTDYEAPTSFDSRLEWPDCIHPIRD